MIIIIYLSLRYRIIVHFQKAAEFHFNTSGKPFLRTQTPLELSGLTLCVANT